MTNARRGVGCQHLLLYLALTVLHEVPEVGPSVYSCLGRRLIQCVRWCFPRR